MVAPMAPATSGQQLAQASQSGQGQAAPAVMTPITWARLLLQRMGQQWGIPDTSSNELAIVAWEEAEGGHWFNTANFNPLNTTQNLNNAPSINGDGVKSYASWDDGLTATMQTLAYPRYAHVLAAFKKGDNPANVAAAVGDSGWGTGNFVSDIAGAWDQYGNTTKRKYGGVVGNTPQTRSGTGTGPNTGAPSPTNPDPNTGAGSVDHCLIHLPSVGGGKLFGLISLPSVGGQCVFATNQARAVVGALSVVAGGLIMLKGVSMLSKGLTDNAAVNAIQKSMANRERENRLFAADERVAQQRSEALDYRQQQEDIRTAASRQREEDRTMAAAQRGQLLTTQRVQRTQAQEAARQETMRQHEEARRQTLGRSIDQQIVRKPRQRKEKVGATPS